MKLLILKVALLVTVVHAYESNMRCTSGPAYWCKSIQNAKECNAFKHCTQTVWTKHAKYLSPVADLDHAQYEAPNKCANCLQCLSTDLRRCAYVNLYKNEVTELLLAKLPATTVCSLLRQCNDDSELVETEQTVPSSSDDSDQTSVVSIDEFLLTNDRRFKCGMHPRNWCDNLKVTRRCQAFDYCLAGWAKSPVKYSVKPVVADASSSVAELASQKACGFCVFVFNKLQSVMQQNATQVEVKEYLEGACNLLPSQEEVKECLSVIDTYYTEIYNMVRNNIDPGIICRVLGACKDKFLTPVEVKDDADYKKVAANLKQINFKVLFFFFF